MDHKETVCEGVDHTVLAQRRVQYDRLWDGDESSGTIWNGNF
jgi:hypothetical protein